MFDKCGWSRDTRISAQHIKAAPGLADLLHQCCNTSFIGNIQSFSMPVFRALLQGLIIHIRNPDFGAICGKKLQPWRGQIQWLRSSKRVIEEHRAVPTLLARADEVIERPVLLRCQMTRLARNSLSELPLVRARYLARSRRCFGSL